jgi:hypothetical protein
VYHHLSFSELCASDVSFVSEGADSSTMSSHSLRVAQSIRLFAFRSPVLRSSCRSCQMSFPSSGVPAVLRLGPLFHCCISGPTVVSSRPSVLYDCGPHALQEWHGPWFGPQLLLSSPPRPLHYGFPDATPWSLLLLDLPQNLWRPYLPRQA